MAAKPSNTVYLITGANRGIGFGLAKALLARPATTVVGTARNATNVAALKSELLKVLCGDGSNFHVASLDLSDLPSPAEIQERFIAETDNEVPRIDVLVSNAGQVSSMGPTLATTADAMRVHFEVNTIAPMLLTQAFWPLMQRESAAARPPKLIYVSSSVGGIEGQEPLPGGAYGPSKAALNWMAKRLHWELADTGVVSLALHPGWVQTAMGDFAANAWSYPGRPPMTVDQSVEAVVKIIDEATRESHSGKFVSYDGQILPW